MAVFEKSKGFTFAELALVLLIIGVIAAITVPTLRKRIYRSQYERGAQKAYLTLNEAFDEAIVLYGSPHKWKNNKDGKNPADMITEQLKLRSNNLTADGMEITTTCTNDRCDLTVEINGPKKEPNKKGRDIFDFELIFAKVNAEENPTDDAGMDKTDKVRPLDTAEKLMQNNWKYTDELWDNPTSGS